MPHKTYKNAGTRTILGIAPGDSATLDDDVAAGFVGPDALEAVEDEPRTWRGRAPDEPDDSRN